MAGAAAAGKQQRIGVLGGTFDPPHMGHLWLAETARQQLELESVLFCPVGDPPHKARWEITAVHHRLAMVRETITGNPSFLLNTTDSDRPPPHATYTLLPLLQAQYPAAQLWLLIGSDGLRDFPTWNQPEQIIRQCRLGVLPRPGVTYQWQTLETAVPGLRRQVDLLAGPTVDISATGLRKWTAQGYSLRYLVSSAARKYIAAHHLYDK